MMKIHIISTNHKKYTLTVSMIHLTITFPTVVTLIKYMCKIKMTDNSISFLKDLITT